MVTVILSPIYYNNFIKLMKPSLTARPELDQQYQKQMQKISQIMHHRQSNFKHIQQPNHISTRFPYPKQQATNTIYKKNNLNSFKLANPDANPNYNSNSNIKLKLKLQPIYSKQRLEPTPSASVSTHRQLSQPYLKKRTRTMSVKQYLVQHDRNKLEQAIKSYELNKKDSRRRIKSQIQQYVKLREHMQRYKSNNWNVVVSSKNVESKEKNKEKVKAMARKIDFSPNEDYKDIIMTERRNNKDESHNQRKNSEKFRKFLTQAIQQTKRRMSPKQFYTHKVQLE